MKHLGLVERVILGALVSILVVIFVALLMAILSSVFGDPCETVHRCQKQKLVAVINNVPHYQCEQYIVEPRDIEACAEKGRN